MFIDDGYDWAHHGKVSAAAELCQRDRNKVRDPLPGRCRQPGCKHRTGSKDFRLCVSHARALGHCQMCGLRKN